MKLENDLPSDIDTPDDTPDETAALYRLLAFAELAARDLKLGITEQLIGAALLSLIESRDQRTDAFVLDRPPGHVH